MTMTWGIVLLKALRQSHRNVSESGTYPDNATMLRAPLVGSRKKAKSRDGSHISVSVLGRYPPTECVRLFVRCIDRFLKLELSMRSTPYPKNPKRGLTKRCCLSSSQ